MTFLYAIRIPWVLSFGVRMREELTETNNHRLCEKGTVTAAMKLFSSHIAIKAIIEASGYLVNLYKYLT